jgi:hypothetical protein
LILALGIVFAVTFGHDWLLGELTHNRGLSEFVLSTATAIRFVLGTATCGTFVLALRMAWPNYRYAEVGTSAKVLQLAVVAFGVSVTLVLMIAL